MSQGMPDDTTRDYFDRLLDTEQTGFGQVGWGSRRSQEQRFAVIAEVGPLAGASLLDVGCGLGEFYGWLRTHEMIPNYLGLDINPRMVERARATWPQARFVTGKVFDLTEQSDFVVASGAFNVRIDDHDAMLRSTITRMFGLARQAVAVNLLSDRADFREDGYYYADPSAMLAFALSLTRLVSLRHDYMTHDFTLILRHETA